MPRTKLHLALAAASLAVLLCLGTCFEVAVVPTPSMERTVLVGDHLLISKILDAPSIPGTPWHLPRFSTVKRGQIVSFRAPGHRDTIFLKRVVAISGDAIEMRGGALYVNDSPVAEAYAPRCTFRADTGRQTVPTGHVFVLGDNRDNSEDSRTWGSVSAASIVGHPLFVIWSLRSKPSDWFDSQGSGTNTFYWTALRHLVASTRWSRTGTWL